MDFQAIITVLVTTMLLLLLLLTNGTNSAKINILSRTNCKGACGDVTIPFPFGMTSNCSLDHSFHISCNQNYNPPKPFFLDSSVEILDISLVDGFIRIASSVATDCYDHSGSRQLNTTISELSLSQQQFTVSSTRNKFTAVGCDTYALVEGSSPGWKQMSAGCVSWCDDVSRVKNGTCSGIGCCQTPIPGGVSDFLVDIRSFRNHTRVRGFNRCGYAFVVEDEAYEFLASDLLDMGSRKRVPVVLDWSVGNVSCGEARMNVSGFGCVANRSECVDSSNGVVGYRCKCLAGFEGNPYLVDGCQDINECDSPEPPCKRGCINSEGSYSCSCPDGFGGDGKKYGSGCHRKTYRDTDHNNASDASLYYVVSGFMIPAIWISWIFWRRKPKKVVQLRRNLFIKNGGKILEDMGGRNTLTVFPADDLEKATNNYDESNIIHRGQDNQGSLYQGTIMSTDGVNRRVTIHKCGQLTADERFISRIVILSEIKHRNVVRLIGCCLETPSPLLVQEFITIKTLYDYIHDNVLSWDVCLRIAADIARVLVDMHSSASSALPIIHGNLSSSGILIHHHYTVKLCDFVLNWPYCSADYFVGVRAGYMDPEYLSSGWLTEKSDVYSFGVVLAELLTGMDPISHEGPLAECFVSLNRDNKLVHILGERMDTFGKIEMLTQAGKLAEKCLSDSSLDRPTMKEVAIALEDIIATSRDSGSIPSSSRGTTTRRVVRRNSIH